MENITGNGKLSRAIRELQSAQGGTRPTGTAPNVRVQNTTRGVIVDAAPGNRRPVGRGSGTDTWMR